VGCINRVKFIPRPGQMFNPWPGKIQLLRGKSRIKRGCLESLAGQRTEIKRYQVSSHRKGNPERWVVGGRRVEEDSKEMRDKATNSVQESGKMGSICRSVACVGGVCEEEGRSVHTGW